MVRVLFGGAVAIILLFLYAYALWYAIGAAECLSAPDCEGYSKNLNVGYRTILEIVGGLVAAIVLTELAVTTPGQTPGGRLVGTADAPGLASTVAGILTSIYFLVWLVFGLWSLFVGFLQHPGVVPVLTSSAKAWLGLAVAAGYSYFGIAPPSSATD